MKARQSIAAIALIISILFAPLIRAGEVVPAGVDVPDWALAVLSFRQLGTSLEKTGAYANNLLPNSAELAKQIIMAELFKLPMNAGIKNGAALILALDPVSTGLQEELAFVLPVGNAEAIKKSFIETFGAPAEKDGVMTFTLPQPLPMPDKIMVAKLVKERLIVAPSELVIKKLENFVEGKTDEMLAGRGTCDAALTIKMPNVKHAFGQLAELGLDMLVQLAGPSRKQEGKAATELLQKIWQLETLEARVELTADGKNGTLEFLAAPQKGSPFSVQLADPGRPVDPSVLRLISPSSALFLAWNVNGAELMKTFKPNASGGDDRSKASADLERALADLIQLVNGHAAVSIGIAPDNSPLTLVGLQASNAKNFNDAVKSLWEKWQKVVKESMRAESQLPGTHVQWRFKNASENYSGTTIESFQAALEGVDAEDQAVIQGAAGWPPTIRFALVGDHALFSIGKDGLDALKQAIDREKTGVAPAAEPLRASLAGQPGLIGALTATNIARLIFANLPIAPKISLEELTRGLTDTPVAISGKADKLLYLRGDVSIPAADAIGTIFQRLQGVNLRLKESEKGGNVPAPPPAQ